MRHNLQGLDISYFLRRAGFYLTTLLFLTFCFALMSCTKEEKDGASRVSSSSIKGELRSAAKTVIEETPLGLASSVLSLIPEDALGFVHFNSLSSGYKSFESSPWNDSENTYLSALTGDPDLNQFLSILKNAGIDLLNPKRRKEIISELIAVVAPPVQGDKEPSLAVLFKQASGVEIDKEMNALTQEVKKNGYEVQEQKFGKASGLRIKKKESVGNADIYVGWQKGSGVFSDRESLVTQILASNGSSSPKILATENFKKATADFAGSQSRFVTGYLDLTRLESPELKSAKENQLPTPDLSEVFQGAAVSMSMEETPSAAVNLLYGSEGKKIFSVANVTTSSKVIKAVPAKPLLFFSFDGATIRNWKKLATEKVAREEKKMGMSGSSPDMVPAIDRLNRISISATLAPLGQSLLPLPDIMILGEASDAEALQSQLLTMSQGLVGAGTDQLPWQEKKIAGNATKYMMTPLGFSVFVTAKNGLLIISSSETQVEKTLTQIDSSSGKQEAIPSFETVLTGRAKEVFTTSASTSNLYVDMGEVASFLETVGGMLAMYAPQNQEAQKFLEKAYLDRLRKMGKLVGNMTSDDTMLKLSCFYQP